jgi:peptidyl-tRNA hydrolase
VTAWSELRGAEPVATITPCRIDPHVAAADFTHYVIVRADLPLGAQLAQVAHAAGESAAAAAHKPAPGTYAVVLHARDAAHLREVADRCRAVGLAAHEVRESVDDPCYPLQLMAVGIEPVVGRDAAKRALSSLPLARERRPPQAR